MKVSEAINKAEYLMQYQKDELLKDLADEHMDEELDKELILRTFLDEFFRIILNSGSVADRLSANEAAELDRLIEELTK